jgi:hypothetical protein
MSICLLTIADKEEHADIQQVSACSGCPYSADSWEGTIVAGDKRIDRCCYYDTPITFDDAKYAYEHDGKPAWCTLDHVIVVHKPKGE